MHTLKPRRWFQFSLQSSLILLTVLGIWLGIQVNRAQRQQQAVVAIQRLGGQLRYDYEVPALVGKSTWIHERSGTTWLRRLIGDHYFDRVAWVAFDAGPDSGRLPPGISGIIGPSPYYSAHPLHGEVFSILTQARRHHVSIWLPEHASQLRESLRHLSGLTHLRTLSLGGTPIEDADLVHISGLRRLEVLGLHGTKIGDAGLEHLDSLANLQDLYLESTSVTDAGLASLAHLPRLKRLWLGGTKITDDGMVHLAKLTRLEHLSLSYTQVGDEEVMRLASLTGLRTLDLWNTRVTARGVAELRLALPSCLIATSDAHDSDWLDVSAATARSPK
ncbi:MAG: hypothetical protein WD847_19970 [Pirellulales bacterium]